ncbi:unknown protein [Seminavis robusta]|uniref:Uncharacterized protein n=1 Tax=Seminavis robusta TaxID=568900 RepID=A0A9N8H2N2_9STRA|nr:unknown protein [Seminavis robusta]|eukprot:Sro21_g014930.1 n/a (233) ;mRNA; r:145503-146201
MVPAAGNLPKPLIHLQLGNHTKRLQVLLQVGAVSDKQLNTTGSSLLFYNYSLPTDPQPSIHLMHIGKTGGTTLRDNVIKWNNCSFGGPKKKQRCLEIFNGVEESTISRYIKGITHYQRTFGKHLSSEDVLLFVVRAPIDRFISWWGQNVPMCVEHRNKCRKRSKLFYQHVQKFYFKCFPSLQSFTQALNPSYNPVKAQSVSDSLPDYSDCNQLLQEAFKTVGMTDSYGHLTA